MRAVVCSCILVACGGPATTVPAAQTSTPAATASPPPVAAAAPAIAYPSARKSDSADDYHGTRVADPYRWMEDLDAPETRAWVEAENRLTFDRLEKLPTRDRFKEELTALWNYERYNLPFRRGNLYFYAKNSGLQNQSPLYVTADLAAEGRILLDPNRLSDDGTVALHDWAVTQDGKLLLYGLATAGSDWVEYRVKRVADGKDFPDVVKWNKFGGAAWAGDGKGFYYRRFEEPKEGALKAENRFPRFFHHTLGTTQEKDELVYERKDQPDWFMNLRITDDGRWLVMTVTSKQSDKNLLLVREAAKKQAKWIEVVGQFTQHVQVIDDIGTKLLLKTDADAPRTRIVSVDTRHPETMTEVVPQAANTLNQARLVNGQLVVEYLVDAHSQLAVLDLAGKRIRALDLPGVGSIGGFSGRRGDREVFFDYESYAQPRTILRADLVAGTQDVLHQPRLAFDPTQYETTQIFGTSKDGTRVPIFITHKKGMPLDGRNPTLMEGYGGFDVTETPAYAAKAVAWIELTKGVFADVVLRGGGEYGESWHEGGMKEHKQNVFDDFIGAAEELAHEKIAAADRLCITGGSNGGLLVGAVLTQRPDLVGCALPQVGVMDMLRFQKFTIGWLWAREYGSSDDAAMFKAIAAYSPLHNVRPGTRYPATLITTADHDDRVFPAHSFKFTATMQAAQAGPAPVLIRIEERAGHGQGKPTSKVIQEAADMLAFAADALGVTL